MNTLLRQLLIIISLVVYTLPLLQMDPLMAIDGHDKVSSCHDHGDHCPNCDDEATHDETDDDCCSDNCHFCLSCCSILEKPLLMQSEQSLGEMKMKTDYLPMLENSHPRFLIRPPIS